MEFNENGNPVVNLKTMQTNDPDIFCGGDFAGVAETTVESVNDGKTAAWYMHERIQVGKVSFWVSKYTFSSETMNTSLFIILTLLPAD